MTIDNDIQSILAIERYLHQSKTPTDIIIENIYKLLQKQPEFTITTTKNRSGRKLQDPTWTITPHNTPVGIIYEINLEGDTLTIATRHLKTTRHYEIANPEFPDNLIHDLLNQLPQSHNHPP
jgi:hypothetical protein